MPFQCSTHTSFSSLIFEFQLPIRSVFDVIGTRVFATLWHFQRNVEKCVDNKVTNGDVF